MNKEDILEGVLSLAKSQGFYGRLYDNIRDNEEVLNHLEAQNFTDIVDMILFLES